MIEPKPIPWKEILEAIFRQFRFIAMISVLGTVVAVIYVLLQPPVYKAIARIQLTAQAMSGPREDSMSEKQIQAEVALLNSEALIVDVLQGNSVDIESDIEETAEPTDDLSDEIQTESTDDLKSIEQSDSEQPPVVETSPSSSELAGEGIDISEAFKGRSAASIAKAISATPIGKSNLVEVAYLDTDPIRAAAFVNSLLEHHVQRIADLNERSSALPLYQQQRDFLAQKWMEAGNELRLYRQQHGSDLLAGDEDHVRSVLANLEIGIVEAETEYLELQARASYLNRALVEYPETVNQEMTVTENEGVKLLKGTILELEIEKSQKLSLYTPTSTIIRDLNRQIEEAKRLLAEKESETLSATTTSLSETHQALEVDLVQTQAKLTSAAARIKALNEQIQLYRGQLSNLETESGELQRLESQVESAKKSHENYLQKEEQARFARSLDESNLVNIVIVEPATVPTIPELSNPQSKIAVWTLASLLAGLLLALIKDWVDPSIKSAAQVSRAGGLPVIGEIPSP